MPGAILLIITITKLTTTNIKLSPHPLHCAAVLEVLIHIYIYT